MPNQDRLTELAGEIGDRAHDTFAYAMYTVDRLHERFDKLIDSDFVQTSMFHVGNTVMAICDKVYDEDKLYDVLEKWRYSKR